MGFHFVHPCTSASRKMIQEDLGKIAHLEHVTPGTLSKRGITSVKESTKRIFYIIALRV